MDFHNNCECPTIQVAYQLHVIESNSLTNYMSYYMVGLLNCILIILLYN